MPKEVQVFKKIPSGPGPNGKVQAKIIVIKGGSVELVALDEDQKAWPVNACNNKQLAELLKQLSGELVHRLKAGKL